MAMRLNEIAMAVNGRLSGEDLTVSSVGIDTRTLKPGDLYIAIKGHNFDGNEFVDAARQAGAVAAIVNQDVTAELPLIQVPDTRLALGRLASVWRRQAGAKAVGMTGSNGKTTVKEMVAAILAGEGPVLATKGNLNNDIGVPLTLLGLTEQHRFAVIEMGANHPGEIAYTSALAQADVVIITNVGPAHIEGFGSVDGVAKAKGEILETLKAGGCAVLNRDDAYFDYWHGLVAGKALISFGLNEQADVTAANIRMGINAGQNPAAPEFTTGFELVTPKGNIEINLKLAGRHNVINALAAAAAALALGLSLAKVKQGLESLLPVTGRLQLLTGRQGNLVIDDTYNANSASLKAALDVLAQCPNEHWLALGAFGELGPESGEIHQQLGTMARAAGVTRLFAVGADARHTVAGFGAGGSFFTDQQALITALQQELETRPVPRPTVLIKGSRAQRMENVAAGLVENFRM